MGGRLTAAALFACLMAACGSGREAELRDVKTLEETMETLRPLHRKLGKPRPGDWLAVQHEPGQTFAQYRASNPVLPQKPVASSTSSRSGSSPTASAGW